jgi:hypothetical protein
MPYWNSMDQIDPKKEKVNEIPFIGGEPTPGTLVEMIYRSETAETAFAVWNETNVEYQPRFRTADRVLRPYSSNNNLIRNRIVLFPSEATEYESEESLVREIRAFIHRYVDVSPLFETLTIYYILLSWVYESCHEIPYNRIRGDFGSGKTRFLLVAGSILFRPIFASGASTVSPIFRILDTFRGSLLIDEGDFRMSDEKAELVKILNNGNAAGFPVLRSEQSVTTKEFNPVAYNVFGPKIVASRGYFQDRALESRFITEETGGRKLRADIPIHLTSDYEKEALSIRNKLLMFRFRNLHTPRSLEDYVNTAVEPRLNQIFCPLLSMISSEETRSELRSLANMYNRELAVDRETDIEAQVLLVIHKLLTADIRTRLAIGAIAGRFRELFGHEYERRVTEKWIGTIVRKKLKLKTQRVQGVFVIPPTEELRLKLLFERYGIINPVENVRDIEDVVDVH